jgi:RNA polymerase sigma-70 factor (ECF subfamily)
MQVKPRNMLCNEPGDEDNYLVAAFLRGDQKAFDELFNKYKDRLFSLCYRFLGSRSDAEDVTQEVFLDIDKGLSGFNAESAFTTWAYKITVRRCYTRLKKQRRSRLLQNDLIVASGSTDMSQLDRIALRQGLAKLPGGYRMLLILKYYQQLSYEEIGEVISCDVGKVKARLRRARLCLKCVLSEETDGGSL